MIDYEANDYEGDEINFKEMPQGMHLYIHDIDKWAVIQSPKDAKAIVESLTRMIKAQEK